MRSNVMSKLDKVYRPREAQAAILDRAYYWVQSVPYQVSARWLFYMLLQEGTYRDKESYKTSFLPLIAKARKMFYRGWRPDTLADDSREPIIRGDGWFTERGWLESLGEAECSLDKWQYQDVYVELWFEAKAMKGQFEHYTKYVTLRPFGGDPSIPYKSQIAKELEQAHQKYDVPVVILYFGDFDPKGLTIPESALKDIRSWCSVPIEFHRAGLNLGDEKKYGIIENPEKPGCYQWEALQDKAAQELITTWVSTYVDYKQFVKAEKREREVTKRFRKNWQAFIGMMGRRKG